jgi:hypothetical protein
MRMTPEEYRIRFPNRRPLVPLEYAGQWLAWNEDHREIVAHATTLRKVSELAVQRGCTDPVFQKIPRGPFIGCEQ